VLPIALLACLTVPVPADEMPPDSIAVLTRLADPVAMLDGEAQAEKMLFHWEKTVYLRRGDGVRQGVAGIAEVLFLDDQSEIRLFGECQMTLASSQADERVIQFRDLARSVIKLKSVRTRLELPDGTSVTGQNTSLRLGQDEMGRVWVIRNAGPTGVVVAGPVVPVLDSMVDAGQQVKIPINRESRPELSESDAVSQDRFEGRLIYLGPGVEATKTDTDLILTGEGLARVGGARVRLPPGGRRIRMWRARP